MKPEESNAVLDAHMSAGKKSNPPVDTTLVRRYYMEGDFEPAIDILETALRYKTGFSHEDSIFIFKHLGVMHVAKYETREKGKQYMLRLLEIEPTARILDMYASDMIYMIFKNIKDEFDASRQHQLGAKSNQANSNYNSPNNGKNLSNPPRKDSHSPRLWLGVAAALAAAGGAATFFYFSDDQKVVSVDHIPD